MKWADRVFTYIAGLSPQRRFVLLFAIGTCGLAASRLSFFSEPYGISVDESTYMALGERILRGGIPYLDALDRKPPGVFWFFALLGKILGPWNIHSLHLMAFLLCGILALLAALASRILTGSRTSAALSGIGYALFSGNFHREVISFNAEYPMLFCCALAVICLLWSQGGSPLRRRAFWAFAGAVLAALATLFKQYAAIIYAPAYLYWAWSLHSQAPPRHKLRSQAVTLFATFAGLSLVYLPVGLWFFRHGALDAFFEWSARDGFRYISAGKTFSSAPMFAALSLAGIALSWIPLWVGTITGMKQWKDPRWRIVFFAGAGSLATACLSGRYYAHYFVPLIWFLSVLASDGLIQQWKTDQFGNRKLVALTLTPLIIMSGFNLFRDDFYSHWKFSRKEQSQMAQAGEWIQRHTHPEDTIVVWGMASQLYPLSGRGSGTRHIFADLVSGRQPGFSSPDARPVPGALQSYISDMEKNQPAVFADTSTAALNDYGYFPPSRTPGLVPYLMSHYRKAAIVGEITLWTRVPPQEKDSPSSTGAEAAEKSQ